MTARTYASGSTLACLGELTLGDRVRLLLSVTLTDHTVSCVLGLRQLFTEPLVLSVPADPGMPGRTVDSVPRALCFVIERLGDAVDDTAPAGDGDEVGSNSHAHG